MKRLLSATANSWRGICCGIRREAALRQEAMALVVAVPVGVLIAPTLAWYVAMIGVVLALCGVEFLNTAIEKLADHTTRERHPDIGMLKDYGSAAVFCMLCLAGLIWIAAAILRIRLF